VAALDAVIGRKTANGSSIIGAYFLGSCRISYLHQLARFFDFSHTAPARANTLLVVVPGEVDSF
jgi:hypothetical protein